MENMCTIYMNGWKTCVLCICIYKSIYIHTCFHQNIYIVSVILKLFIIFKGINLCVNIWVYFESVDNIFRGVLGDVRCMDNFLLFCDG